MADLSDVENALVAIVAGALFPSAYLPGAYQASAVGTVCKLYRGWPESANLNADMALGRAHVSVFSDPGMTRNVSRWPINTVQISAFTPTLTVAVSGATVTIGGTVTAGNVVGLQFGKPSAAYAYAALSTDTLATIAAAIVAKIPGATSSGAVITLPTVLGVGAGVMVLQNALTVTRQQEQGIRVSIWAPTPAARDNIAAVIDNALACLKNAISGAPTRFFPVGSSEFARLAYRTTYSNDMPARDRIWRRDLCYTVEYPTTLIEQDPAVLFAGGHFWSNYVVLNQWGAE
jgi:hypothetical protein